MIEPIPLSTMMCPTDDIAAYIDGELNAEREFELEAHLLVCEGCAQSLTQQKQFLCGLNSSLKHERDIELPANFTKLVVANAESTVAGLRRPRERFNALFICAGLMLFVLFALGTDAIKVFDGVTAVVEQTATVGGFFGRLVYSVFIGVTIILRSVAVQFRFDIGLAVALTTVVAALLMYISRRALRVRGA